MEFKVVVVDDVVVPQVYRSPSVFSALPFFSSLLLILPLCEGSGRPLRANSGHPLCEGSGLACLVGGVSAGLRSAWRPVAYTCNGYQGSH
jgi:hypothetical protein